MDWIFNNPGKTFTALGLGMIACVLTFSWGIQRMVTDYNRHVQIQKACEAQSGIYLDGACKKPSEIVTPK